MTLVRTLVVLVLLGFGTAALAATPLPLDPPDVSFVGSDRTSITLQVRAGSSGAPAGFVVEWLPRDEYVAFGGWPNEVYTSDSRFHGVPTLYVTPGTASFQLGPDQTVYVVLGKLFDETGIANASDTDELFDGTEYVIRVRAEATATTGRSPFSPALLARTQQRTATDCTVTQGFWKSHGEAWDRVSSVRLGTVTYSNAQLHAIFAQPARGNGLVSLAHQLLAVKLNMLLGALPPPEMTPLIAQADALIGSNVIPPIGSGWLSPQATAELTGTFDSFNTGRIGPGHCPKDLRVVPTVQSTWGTLKAIYR